MHVCASVATICFRVYAPTEGVLMASADPPYKFAELLGRLVYHAG